ncbi:MAG: hypothetical protein WCK35_04435 [Chloroflexota bacterium]
MRLYRRAIKTDMMDTINRCYFDADHGRIKLALDRLKDLEAELGEQPRILYAEGMLRKDLLGQGLLAFNCFAHALELDPGYANAACNAAVNAPNETEYRKYSAIAARLSPADRPSLEHGLELLDQGTPYWQIVLNQIGDDEQTPAYGSALDLALASETLPEENELSSRTARFQLLRKQDLVDQKMRELMAEDFPPNERLALLEALKELEKTIELDPYDATFWNFRSGWNNLLRRYHDAILFADKAIELRPDGYHRPHHNKAIAYFRLGKKTEALACAREALVQMEKSGEREDAKIVQDLIDEVNKPDHITSWHEILPLLSQIIQAAHLRAEQELDVIGGNSKNTRITVIQAKQLFEYRIKNLHPNPKNALHYVPAMAHILTYFSPEVCFTILQEIQKTDQLTFENCMLANLYLPAFGEPILQRDALRLNIITMFAEAIKTGSQESIRNQYRKLILDVSAVASNEMANLDQSMRKELELIHPDLPRLISDQNPSSQAEKLQAQNTILARLQGIPYVVDSNTPETLPDWNQTGSPASQSSCLAVSISTIGLSLIIYAGVSILSKTYQLDLFSGFPKTALSIALIIAVSGAISYWRTKTQ